MNFKRIVNIDFRRCSIGLRKGKCFILLLTILGLVVGILVTVFGVSKENEYTATSSVYCISYGDYTESQSGTSAMRTYSSIIKSRRIAEHAAMLIADPDITSDDVYEKVGVDSLYVQGLTYAYENNSPIISIHAVDENEQTAVSIVNAVADAFVQEVNGLSNTDAIRILDYAYEGKLTYNAMLTCFLTLVFAAVCGLLLGCVIILGTIIFTDRVISVDDAGLYGQLNVVGIIPDFEDSRRE